jgi:fibronectin type 3 domain-containing protein
MKLWILSSSLTALLLILSSCAGVSPSPKEEVTIDATLPTISLTNHGKIVGMTSVAFEWRSFEDSRVKGIYIYKQKPTKDGVSELLYFKTIDSRFKTHYVDTKVQPDTRYTYAFKTFSQDAEGIMSTSIAVNTLPVLESVSWIDKITGLPRVAKIIWRPHSNEKVKAYIIERKILEDETWHKIATINGRLNAEFVDENLNDNYVYMYRVRVLTFDNIVSTPSQIVKVVTKALPLSVTGISTTTTLPKEIKINWSRSTQEDVTSYYLYRSTRIDVGYQLIAKLDNNSFVDKIDEDGKTFFYRVSVVDSDGLESINNKNSIQGMTLTKPNAPALAEAKFVNNVVELQWSKTDPRSSSYTVIKTRKKGWFDEDSEEFTGIQSGKFVDRNIKPNSTYRYSVYALDSNGIKSESSSVAVIVTSESTEIIKAPQKEVIVEERVVVPVVTQEAQDVVEASDDLDLSGL